MSDVTIESLHERMNFLLKDHGVENFDEASLDLESISSLHAKANALCAAHGGDPSRMADETLEQLHPKLDFLLKGHGVDFDQPDLDLKTLASVEAKVIAIVNAHDD